ncbi:MAG: hypothetical protein ACKO34_08895 [Vampirovibrionales bacterium]
MITASSISLLPANTVYAFGTSGYRSNTDAGFNTAVVSQITHAIADTLIVDMHKTGKAGPVLVGGDTRPKTKESIPLIVDILLQRGLDVYQIDGDVPTPVLAYAANALEVLTGNNQGAAGAILMTASHNPWDYGGYNFLTPDGAVAPSELSKTFEYYQQHPLGVLLNRETLGLPATPECKSLLPYEAYYRHLLHGLQLDANALKQANLNIGYDPLYATGRYYFPKLLEDLGVQQVTVFHGDDVRPDGYHGEPEPSPENLTELASWLQGTYAQQPQALTVGFANDGDSDRFGVLDEQGTYLVPNTVLKLVLYSLMEHRLPADTQGVVVRSQATTHALDSLAAQRGWPVIQTPVGYKYIAESFIEQAQQHPEQPVLLGGESSGGLSIVNHVPEKDGLLANLLIAELIAKEGKPLSQIVTHVDAQLSTAYSFREYALRTEAKQAFVDYALSLFHSDAGSETLVAGFTLDVATTNQEANKLKQHFGTQDGVKLYFTNGAWALVRTSGTEPLARLCVETQGSTLAEAEAQAETLSQHFLAWLQEHHGLTPADIKRKA